MGRGGGGARIGCAAFSLLGLLIGVGLTVWLSSKVLDGATPPVGRNRTTATTETTAETAAGPGAIPAASDAVLRLDPAADLTDGQVVRVAGAAFPAGATVALRQCLGSAAASVVLGDAPPCDESTDPVVAVADAEGAFTAEVAVRTVVVAGSLPFDCAHEQGTCAVVAAVGTDPSGTASAALTFAAGARPELTLPGE